MIVDQHVLHLVHDGIFPVVQHLRQVWTAPAVWFVWDSEETSDWASGYKKAHLKMLCIIPVILICQHIFIIVLKEEAKHLWRMSLRLHLFNLIYSELFLIYYLLALDFTSFQSVSGKLTTRGALKQIIYKTCDFCPQDYFFYFSKVPS